MILKPLADMIRELDELTEAQEEWRKAQGIPKQTYKPKKEEEENNEHS